MKYLILLLLALTSCAPSFYSHDGTVTKVKPSNKDGFEVITVKANVRSFYEPAKVNMRVPKGSYVKGDTVWVICN